MDNLTYVSRYSYFGSFRADDATTWIGPNGSMLNNDGRLTDIGAWYLGMAETNVAPESGGDGDSRAAATASFASPLSWLLLGALWLAVSWLG
jgi:hypothetical protein